MSAYAFLIETLFGLYLLAIMLRFLLQLARADFYNDLVQFLVKVTNPPLRPLRRFIPGLMGLDLAAIVLMLILKTIELLLLGVKPSGNLVLLAGAELIWLAINIFLIAIIIRVILSWFNFLGPHPLVNLLYQLTEPVLEPIRRLLPAMSGLDLSPLLASIALIFLSKLVQDLLAVLGVG